MEYIYIIRILDSIAAQSKCNRSKVGAILMRDGRIVSSGFNGTVKGDDNNCEDNHETKNTVVHAEQNVISFCAKNGISTDKCELYVSMSPCEHCAKMIIQAGINKVYYKHIYRDKGGIELLVSSGVECYKVGL